MTLVRFAKPGAGFGDVLRGEFEYEQGDDVVRYTFDPDWYVNEEREIPDDVWKEMHKQGFGAHFVEIPGKTKPAPKPDHVPVVVDDDDNDSETPKRGRTKPNK